MTHLGWTFSLTDVKPLEISIPHSKVYPQAACLELHAIEAQQALVPEGPKDAAAWWTGVCLKAHLEVK